MSRIRIADGDKFAVLHESMYRDFRLTALDWRVIHYLSRQAENWVASQADIAQKVNSDPRAIRKSLAHLVELGYGEIVSKATEKSKRMEDFVLYPVSDSCPPEKQQVGTTVPISRNHSSCSSGTTVPTNESNNESKNESNLVPKEPKEPKEPDSACARGGLDELGRRTWLDPDEERSIDRDWLAALNIKPIDRGVREPYAAYKVGRAGHFSTSVH